MYALDAISRYYDIIIFFSEHISFQCNDWFIKLSEMISTVLKVLLKLKCFFYAESCWLTLIYIIVVAVNVF